MTSGSIRRATIAALLVWSTAALADPPTPSPGPQMGPVATPSSKPDVATLLFGTPQWDKAPAGAKLRYSYDKSTGETSFGAPLKDEVVLTLTPGENARSRATEMQLFSGPNRLPAGPFRSDEQNPVLLVILENNVQELSKLFKANPRYIKNAIRKAWRDDAKIEPVSLTVDGKPMTGTRISVTPFKGDAEAERMKGLSALSYVVDVAEGVPGYIAAIDIRTPVDAKPLFSETLRYASETKP